MSDGNYQLLVVQKNKILVTQLDSQGDLVDSKQFKTSEEPPEGGAKTVMGNDGTIYYLTKGKESEGS